MKIILTICSVMLLISSSAQEDMQKHYKIFDTKKKSLITIDELAEASRNADVLFFGEEHNDSTGHFLEFKIFSALHKLHGPNLTLSMEMFESDGQLVLNEYLHGHINEDRLKDARLWNNYKDYRPMVEYSKQNGLHVIAANPPRRYVNIVSRKGMSALDSLPSSSKKFLPPLPYDTATGKYREKFNAIMKGSPGSDNPRIFYSQNLWDAGMAYSIFHYLKKKKNKKIFHVVGRFHSDEKLGTVAQLQKYKPSLHIMNISCFSDTSFENPDWEKFLELGDFVIVTDPKVKKSF